MHGSMFVKWVSPVGKSNWREFVLKKIHTSGMIFSSHKWEFFSPSVGKIKFRLVGKDKKKEKKGKKRGERERERERKCKKQNENSLLIH